MASWFTLIPGFAFSKSAMISAIAPLVASLGSVCQIVTTLSAAWAAPTAAIIARAAAPARSQCCLGIITFLPYL